MNAKEQSEDAQRHAREQMTTEQNTNAIERTFNRAIHECLRTLKNAVTEASTYTKPSEIVPEQQAYLERMRKLHDALFDGSKNPTGEFNWDWV